MIQKPPDDLSNAIPFKTSLELVPCVEEIDVGERKYCTLPETESMLMMVSCNHIFARISLPTHSSSLI